MMTSTGQSEFRLVVDTDSSNVALVLGASKGLKSSRADVLSATLHVAQSLPASVDCSIFFLGNSRRYSVKEFASRGTALFDENESRASLIAPVMRGIKEHGTTTRLAILGAERVFDLGDWDYCAAPMAFMTSQNLDRCRPISDAHALAEALFDRVERVVISLSNLAPSDWDNAGHKIVLTSGQMYLCGETLPNFDVRVKGLRIGNIWPKAQVFHASGKVVDRELSLESSFEPDMPQVELSDIEAQTFRSMVRGSRFFCPLCGEEHASHALRCDNDVSPRFRIQGRPIYECLDHVGRRGLFVCTDNGAGVRCAFAGQSLLDTDRGRVFFALDNGRLYWATLEGERVDWKTTRRVQNTYSQLQDHRYVVLYR